MEHEEWRQPYFDAVGVHMPRPPKDHEWVMYIYGDFKNNENDLFVLSLRNKKECCCEVKFNLLDDDLLVVGGKQLIVDQANSLLKTHEAHILRQDSISQLFRFVKGDDSGDAAVTERVYWAPNRLF